MKQLLTKKKSILEYKRGLSVVGGGAAVDSLTTGLLAYYKLDEASGTALDVLGAHDLTALNNPLGVIGKVGNARNLVLASTQFLRNTSFSLPDADFTLACWVKFTTVATDNMALMSNLATYPQGQFLISTDASRLDFGLHQDTGARLGVVQCSTFGNLSNGIWYHVVCTRNKATDKIRIYLNTVMNEASAAGVMGTSANFYIGAWSSGGHPLNAAVDEVGVWSRVLTDAEIARLYNA